ncbi:hypothetical protein 3 [Wenling crustacean virus 10]|uniref:Uncharacterized protein n=1 Tax=Wenling crustacean virus 10 TaxID=1923479 RepID=A0A1L3KN34_9RHAB|nr:hypothetical protein 3 [Wenling crustacean virus 10]APG78821.1 hypothetical protein 3 [Wenling crustacean virus 10]
MQCRFRKNKTPEKLDIMSNLVIKLCAEGTIVGTPAHSWAQIASTIVDALFKDCGFSPKIMAQIIVLLHESLRDKVQETPVRRTIISLKDEIEKEWVTKRTYNCKLVAHTSFPYSPDLNGFLKKLNLELSGEGKEGTVVVSLRLQGELRCKPTNYDPQTIQDLRFVPLPPVGKVLTEQISKLRAKTKNQIEVPKDHGQDEGKGASSKGRLKGLFSGLKAKE